MLRADGDFFRDSSSNHVLMLRGANVGGNSKLPRGVASHDKFDLKTPGQVSFVGKPFPLKDAHAHFRRMKVWGFTLIRFIVTWEAIEHAGPGIYDEEYLQYVHDVLQIALEYDLKVYIDPHQDVWSRWTGGDGAPYWTLTEAGMVLQNIPSTLAGVRHSDAYSQRPDKFPKMVWPTNYFKYACQTMFTLFWAGNDLAPGLDAVQHDQDNKETIQDFLQDHYIAAMCALAAKLKDLPNIVGYGTMNEPSSGYIGVKDLNVDTCPIKKGCLPTPLQAMQLADGLPTRVGWYDPDGILNFITGNPTETHVANTLGAKVFDSKQVQGCVWKSLGVWNRSEGILEPDYFCQKDFGRDYYLPFAKKYITALRKATGDPALIIFVEMPPADFATCEFPEITKEELPQAVNASHWYDGVTLFTGKYSSWVSIDVESKMPVFGSSIRTGMEAQLAKLKQLSVDKMHHVPTLIGEVGIPMDMNKAAFKNNNWSDQIECLHRSIRAMETNLLSYTLWNYCASNTNQHGDGWNGEDLSLFSIDQARGDTLMKSGGRAQPAFVRPYAYRIAGTPSLMNFHKTKAVFELKFSTDSELDGKITNAETKIYVPNFHYPHGYSVQVSDGAAVTTILTDAENSELYSIVVYTHTSERTKHHLKITRKRKARI